MGTESVEGYCAAVEAYCQYLAHWGASGGKLEDAILVMLRVLQVRS